MMEKNSGMVKKVDKSEQNESVADGIVLLEKIQKLGIGEDNRTQVIPYEKQYIDGRSKRNHPNLKRIASIN